MTAHAALPADRHRAGFTEEQEYLQSGGKDGHIRLVLKMVQTETASASDKQTMGAGHKSDIFDLSELYSETY